MSCILRKPLEYFRALKSAVSLKQDIMAVGENLLEFPRLKKRGLIEAHGTTKYQEGGNFRALKSAVSLKLSLGRILDARCY